MWLRRLLDEERVLADVVPAGSVRDLERVKEVNQRVAEELDNREVLVKDRYDVDQWLTLCKLTESPEEVHGVEALLEALPGPLKVVYTVALDEVKQFVTRWVEAIVKEAEALIKAKA
eukprot:s15217_g1.t1